jgi:hypothetical protein
MGSSQSCSDTGLDGTPDGLRTAKAQRRDQAILIILCAFDDSPGIKLHSSLALKFCFTVFVAVVCLRQNQDDFPFLSQLRHRQHTHKLSTICKIHFGG